MKFFKKFCSVFSFALLTAPSFAANEKSKSETLDGKVEKTVSGCTSMVIGWYTSSEESMRKILPLESFQQVPIIGTETDEKIREMIIIAKGMKFDPSDTKVIQLTMDEQLKQSTSLAPAINELVLKAYPKFWNRCIEVYTKMFKECSNASAANFAECGFKKFPNENQELALFNKKMKLLMDLAPHMKK